MGEWSEARHLDRYLDLVNQARTTQPGQSLYRPVLTRVARRSEATANRLTPD